MSQSEEVKPEGEESKQDGNPIGDFWKEVESALATSAEVARARLKDFYVEEELQERTTLLKKGFAKSRESKKELQKMKPDMKSRDLQGKLVEAWSNEAWDKKQKAVEALTKLDKALTAALEGKYEDLKKLV
jgi:hypothetical protein